MKLISKYKNLELIVEEKLLIRIREYGIKQFPKEFGGFLVGYYSNDMKTLYISDFLLPKKYKSFSFLFERSVEGMKKVFKKLFLTKSQFYVGEWHTHPNGSTMYSKTDLQAMTEIEKCETVRITNPILLILSLDKEHKTEYSFYIYNKNKLIKYDQN